jgi:hypothetical protein
LSRRDASELQAVRHLVLTPACLNLVLDLVERAVALRRDACHFIPDVATVDLQRIVVGADVSRERAGYQALLLRQVGDGLVGWVAPEAVDLHGTSFELELLGRLGERLAERALILDLVVNRSDLGLGPLIGEIGAKLLGGFLESRTFSGSIW